MSLIRRRSMSSSGRNRIQPVAVGPGPVSGLADLTGCADMGPGNTTAPLAADESLNQTKGEHRSRWSLRNGLNFLRKSSRKTPSKSVKKNRSLSTLSSLSTSRTKRQPTKLNKDLYTYTPKLLHSTRLNVEMPQTDGKDGSIKGALGLTPLSAMFSIQSTISTNNAVAKENQPLNTTSKKYSKSGNKTPSRSLSRRRILGILNRKEGTCTTDNNNCSFLDNNTKIGIGNQSYFTRSRSKSSLDSERSDGRGTEERLNHTIDVAGGGGLDDTQTSFAGLDVSKTSTRSVPMLPTLSREPSPGNCAMMDLSLESEIMKTLYPNGAKSILDVSSAENSPFVETIFSASGGGKSSRRRSYGMSRSQSCLPATRRRSSSHSASQVIGSQSDSFKALVDRLAEHTGLPADDISPKQCFPPMKTNSKSFSSALSNRSFVKVKARSQTFRSDSPVERKRKQEVRFGDDSVISRPKKIRRKSLGAAEGVSERQKRRVVRPIIRSRSLRVWRQKESVEVTGEAGHTPLPRRRRPTSYNERLIM